jgi:death-on-curing protein
VRYLTLAEVLDLHRQVIEQTKGSQAIRDLSGLTSAVAQPRMTFEGRDLYPSLEEKAGALCFSLILNHPFLDGNKRLGHAAMETFLILNGCEIHASIDEQEAIILEVAAGKCSREKLVEWIRAHTGKC